MAAGSGRQEDEAPSAAARSHSDTTAINGTSSTTAVQKQHSLQQKQYASSSTFDHISDLLDEVDHDGLAILLRRPDCISLSHYSPQVQRRDDVVDCINLLSGLQFRASEKGSIVIDGMHQQQSHTSDDNNNTGTLTSRSINSCSLLEGSRHSLTFFDLGDVVEYACGVDCRQCGREVVARETTSNGDNTQALTQTNKDVTMDILIKIRDSISEEFDQFDTTMCVTTAKSAGEPARLCQAIVLLPKMDRSDFETNIIDIGITFSQQDNRLIIESISKDNSNWFGSTGCAIQEGHIVVGVNEFITLEVSPMDATSIIQDILSSPESTQLSISTIDPVQANKLTRWDKIRKAAVAAGGGTLIASGAVLMVTPLHPVGHAMALGGVGVLGAEFEAPRKVMESAKERWSERRRRLQRDRSKGEACTEVKGDNGEPG